MSIPSKPSSNDFAQTLTCAGCANINLTSPFNDALSYQDIHMGLQGTIAYLPLARHVDVRSVAHCQAALNAGAYGHPNIIIKSSDCGHLVFCVPVTSWGGQTIHQKYSNAFRSRQRIFGEYMPLSRPDTIPHNELGVLDHSGLPMPKQSYARLDDGYWIDWKLLSRYEQPAGRRKLSQGAFWLLMRHYEDAEIKVMQYGKRKQFNTPPRTPSPQNLTYNMAPWGNPVLTPPASPTKVNFARAAAAPCAVSAVANIPSPTPSPQKKSLMMNGPWRPSGTPANAAASATTQLSATAQSFTPSPAKDLTKNWRAV